MNYLNYIYFISGIILSFFLGYTLSSFINSKLNENKLIYSIDNFKKAIDEYKNQNILSTKEVKDALGDAQKLARTLTTNQNLKGQFAEDCLEEVLCACFPNKDINYVKQYVSKNEDDKEIKPDYLVKLPENKSILIDCKLNLDKFLEYKNNPNKITKNDFIKDINTTINLLSNKKYNTANGLNQPDFILMYIPLEPALTVIYTDSDCLNIVRNASNKNIIIVGNSSVITVLKLTRILWAKSVQNENTNNIINLAQNLYDIVAQHSRNLYEMKNILESCSEKFNKEYEKISNEGKLFKVVEELKQYGIQAQNKKLGRKTDEITINPDFLG